MNAIESTWREVYETYSLWGLTDPNAPVQASGEILIDASPQRVWDVLTDVQSWAMLRPDIDGAVGRGTSCTLTTAGIDLTLIFGLMTPPQEINWTTTTTGLVMTNRYVLVPQDDKTHVVCHETVTAPSFPQIDQAALAERISVWLSAVALQSIEKRQ